MYLLVTPSEYTDKEKKYKTGGPICIKTSDGLSYLLFKTKKLAEYCKNLYNVEAKVEPFSMLKKKRLELNNEINKVFIFPSLTIFNEYHKDRKNFGYSKYTKDINQLIFK